MEESFKLGDEVIWREPADEGRVRRYGEGPFTVFRSEFFRGREWLTIIDQFGEKHKFRASDFESVQNSV